MMAVGTTTALLLGGGAAFGAQKLLSGSKMPDAQPIPLPQPPSSDAAADKGADLAKRKRLASTKSIYSSPLGIGGEADVARKTLLGQ